jgi:hypothetical protein
VHEFDVEVAGCEASGQVRERRTRPREVPGTDRRARLSVRASAESDESFREASEVRQRDNARLVRRADVGPRKQAAEVAVPAEIANEQREVEADACSTPEPDRRRQYEALGGGKVALLPAHSGTLDDYLGSEDRPYPGLLCRPVEPERPVEPLMVGERERTHAEFSGPFDQPAEVGRTVTEAEAGVDVQMDEGLPHRIL